VTGKADNPAMQREAVELLRAAREAAARAWAPYSGYRVGAAIRTRKGEVVSGCNVENASYGLSICAERNAVFAARARGLLDPQDAPIAAIAVHAQDRATPWPCGACRQVLLEFASPDVPVLVDAAEGVVETTLGALLPHAFRLEDRWNRR
jgi:homotetrameric cytidine deaminase